VLPSRTEDGYGLARHTVDRLAERGTDLLITADCAITAVDEVAAARAAGIEVVVTDHHQPRADGVLPDAPIVHPGLGGYPCPELCAAGVAHKVVAALLIVALLSVLRGYERASGPLLSALVLALMGVALIVVPEQALTLPRDYAAGLAWSFASAALYSLVVLGNARMPAHVPAVSASAWGMTVAALLMFMLAGAQGITWPRDGTAWLQVAYTGVATTSVAYLAFAWGARRLSPTAAVVGTLIDPLVAALAAAWLFAEPLTARQGVGAVLLGVAILLLARRRSA